MGRTWVARGRSARAAPAICALVLGCSAGAAKQGPVRAARAPSVASSASDGAEVFSFPEATQSPLPVARETTALAPFFAECKQGDAGLGRVAERFARRQAEGDSALDTSELSFALRAEGSPYVRPHAWTLQGADLESPGAVERMRAWLASFDDGGERRCGVARADARGGQVLAVVAVDALADLEPLPVRWRAGAWVDVNASFLVPASAAKVIVLGPSGAPMPVPTSFDGQRARARFHADRPGAFLVQLLADVAGGPRPVLEASVYADASPPSSYVGDAAPGEPTGPLDPRADRATALLAMINQARESERSPALERDARLDAIAESHAQAMRRQRRVAHDAGDGDPQSRVEAAALDPLTTGENIAHAHDIRRAHRVLWASPSHRENLLQARFDRVGIGVAPDPDGSIWVCEVFADFPDRVVERR